MRCSLDDPLSERTSAAASIRFEQRAFSLVFERHLPDG